MKKKKKKILFSLGGLASSSHHFNNIDQLDHIQTLLPTSPVELAVTLPRDSGVRLPNYASDRLVYGYDSENDDDYYLYHGAFALGGDTEKDFARHHWMIDSGCTDHLSPFLDDFAHLGNMVRHAVIANGQKVPTYVWSWQDNHQSKDQGIRTSCSERSVVRSTCRPLTSVGTNTY